MRVKGMRPRSPNDLGEPPSTEGQEDESATDDHSAMNEQALTDRTRARFRVTLAWGIAAGTFLWWLLVLGVERLVL